MRVKASAISSSAASQPIGSNCSGALGALAPQRREQPVRMLDALGVAGDLGAHHAQGVAVVARARDPPDAAVGQHRHLQRAGARAIVRAGGLGDASHQLLHELSLAPTGVRLLCPQYHGSGSTSTAASLATSSTVRANQPLSRLAADITVLINRALTHRSADSTVAGGRPAPKQVASPGGSTWRQQAWRRVNGPRPRSSSSGWSRTASTRCSACRACRTIPSSMPCTTRPTASGPSTPATSRGPPTWRSARPWPPASLPPIAWCRARASSTPPRRCRRPTATTRRCWRSPARCRWPTSTATPATCTTSPTSSASCSA